MNVQDVMSKEVKTCLLGDTANRAAELMWDHDCGLVVVLTFDGRVAGIVTDRDLCMAGYTQGLPLAEIDLAGVMSTQIVSCAPDDELGVAAARMKAFQVRRLPVIDAEGWLVGVLSLNDLARRAATDRKTPARSLALETIADTLAEVSKPRCPLARAPRVPATSCESVLDGQLLLTS